MLWRLLVALAFALLPSVAGAVCSNTISGKDGGGASITTCATTDGGTNLVPSTGILGGASNANKLSISAGGAALVDGSATTQPISGSVSISGTVAATESGTWTVQPGNTANTTPWLTTINQGGNSATVSAGGALKVDGSAATQPVSGTVTANAGTGTFTNQQSNVQVDYDTGVGVQNMTVFGIALPASGGAVAGGTATNPLRIDPTGTTTQPVSGTVAINANSSVNVNQVGGTAVDTNSGVKSAGTQRVVIATDQPALTNALKVDGSAVTQPVSGTVTAVSAGCAGATEANTTTTPISITANAQIITGVAAQKVRICALNLVVGAATNVALVEGTGAVCATGIAGMAGGATAATGWNLAANGGLTYGNGSHAVFKTATNADNVCLLVSAANQVSGSVTWASF